MPLIALLTWRFARLVTPLSRVVQQRKADLTEAADESVVGMEMVQAFGREAEVRERFRERAEGVRTSALREAAVEARSCRACSSSRTWRLRPCSSSGAGRPSRATSRSASSCSSTASCCSSCGRSRRSAGSSTSPSAPSPPRAARSPGWMPSSRCPRPSTRSSCRMGRSTCASRTSASPTPGGHPCCAISISRSPGSIVAVCGETGAGKSTC